MLDGEAIQAALLAASGEVQALMNHLGLAARSAPATKLAFEDDLRTSLRKALQFGRAELVSVESSLANTGPLSHPTDVQWHPRGEDHGGFAGGALEDVVKMAVARTKGLVEQGAVLVAAPARFWRWLPGFAEDRAGFELLDPDPDSPASVKSSFLAEGAWDFVFAAGMDPELPERLWSSVLGGAEVRAPWAEMELRLLDVKGLGPARAVRS